MITHVVSFPIVILKHYLPYQYVRSYMKRMTSRIFTLILENSDEAHCRHPTAPVLLTPWGVSFLGCASDQSLLGLKPGAQLSGNGSNLNILGNHLIFDLIWASKSQAM